MAIRIGCVDYPIPPSRYFRKWNLVEIQQTLVQMPGDGTVKRWLRESSPGFEFVVAVSPLVTIGPFSTAFRYLPAPPRSEWKQYQPFAGTREVSAAYAETLALADELKAKILVFQTAADFPVGDKTAMAAFRRFFERTDRKRRRFVWESKGGWSYKEATALAKDLDLIYCVDPLHEPIPDPEFAYFHLPGPAGFRSRYEEEALVRLRDICKSCREVYCLFANIDMNNDAARFHVVLQTERS